MPEISVAMSVYNEKVEWLIESIDSILNQTYRDFEFIIVVDNPCLSSDVQKLLVEKKSADSRIVLIYNKTNIGLAMSLNKAIASASGSYIARMDADDISMPNRFENELAFIKKCDCDVVATSWYVIDEKSEIVSIVKKSIIDVKKELIRTNCILHPSVLMKKETILRAGGYRNFKRSQDYDLWLRCISLNYKICLLDSALLKYRIRKGNLSDTNRLEQYYTNLYQKKLFYERKKEGVDSFSEENYQKFILSKKITPRKNEKCKRSLKHLDKAKCLMEKRKFFVFELLKAFCYYPKIVTHTIFENIYFSFLRKK